jgi:hypothetical protein
MYLLYQQEDDRLLALLFVMQLNQLILFLAYRQIEHQTIHDVNHLFELTHHNNRDDNEVDRRKAYVGNVEPKAISDHPLM